MTFPVPAGWNVYPTSINDAPATTGSYSIGQGPNIGFLVAWPNTAIAFYPPGSVDTRPVSINAFGVIAGTYWGQTQGARGFLRDAQGNFTTFNVPSQPITRVASLNNFGTVTGYTGSCQDLACTFYGYVRDPQGKMDFFNPQGSWSTMPTAINDYGVIVGAYQTAFWWPWPSGPNRGFVRDAAGTITTFDAEPNGKDTYPTGINVFGTITGHCQNSAGAERGFVRSAGGAVTVFEAPGASSTEPTSISWWTGDVTGSYVDASLPESSRKHHGFIRLANGSITTFDPPNSKGTFPTSIDDWGVVVGYYIDANTGVNVGFVRTP